MFDGKIVTLRTLELSDIDAIMEHWNDLEFRQNCGRAMVQSREEQLEFIKRTWKMRQEGKGYFFAIIDKETKKYLGHVALCVNNHIARSFELGIFIYNKNDWNKGYGTDAMEVILHFGFNYLNLHRIGLSVYPNNERGIHVYKKLGFKETGRKRKTRFMNGEYRDEILMDILQEEWLEKEKN